MLLYGVIHLHFPLASAQSLETRRHSYIFIVCISVFLLLRGSFSHQCVALKCKETEDIYRYGRYSPTEIVIPIPRGH